MAKFQRRATPSPSFNRGWRLGVAIGASLVLLFVAWMILATLGKVWNAYV